MKVVSSARSIRARALALVLAACGDRPIAVDSADDTSTPTTTTTTAASPSNGSADETTVIGEDGMKYDTLVETTGEPSDCEECDRFDVLLVVDNSGSMAQEQAHVAAGFVTIVDAIQALTDSAGTPLNVDVNIMVTTTDVGHPLCTGLRKPGYTPRAGAPVYEGCNARIDRFTGLGADPEVVEEACTNACPEDIVPTDPFVHFDSAGTNVPNGTPQQALACIGPQGIDGCEYESPLEAMLRALDPEACWNDPAQEGCADDPEWGQFDEPFLRDGASLVIMFITDDTDCSVDAPGGFAYFTDPDNDEYWEIDPDTAMRSPSSAVCWNAGVSCDGPDVDGAWADCVATDNPVLHSTDRYLDALLSLRELQRKEVHVLGILGVPAVTAHNPFPPFEPTAGGVLALAPRVWTEADLTAAEIDAGITVADKVWEVGDIAPGCASETGNAIFPTRVQEVCEGMSLPDDPQTRGIDEFAPRCCIESICEHDYAAAIRCATPIKPFSPKG